MHTKGKTHINATINPKCTTPTNTHTPQTIAGKTIKAGTVYTILNLK